MVSLGKDSAPHCQRRNGCDYAVGQLFRPLNADGAAAARRLYHAKLRRASQAYVGILDDEQFRPVIE